jgi:putative ABC transport system substrate-binding protein
VRRREFVQGIAGSAMAWPFAVRAQPSERTHRIGALIAYAENDPETNFRIAAFRAGLAKRGWSEDHTVHIDYRFAAATTSLYPKLAKELVSLHPEVILAHTTPAVVAIRQETNVIPTVFVNVSDPIGEGFVASLARPGANLTGVLHYEQSIVGKWLSMLKEIAPQTSRIALVANPKTSPFDYFLKAAQQMALQLAIEIVPSPVTNSAADIEHVLNAIAQTPNSSLVITPDGTTIQHRDLIVSLAAKYRLPAVYPFDFFVLAGGLMSYGTDQNDMFRLAASYVDRILRGDKPADLPVQAPTRFEMSLNVKTAKAMGLTVPPGLIVAADSVIE